MSTKHCIRRLLAIVPLSGAAAAQCPDWSQGFLPAGMDASVRAIAVYDAGDGPMLYACGSFQRANGENAPGVARLEGTQWRGITPQIQGPCRALAVYDDGSGPALFVGGTNLAVDGVTIGNLVRWNGVSAFGLGPDGPVNALEVFDGGGTGPVLYAGGTFENAGSQFSPGLARWNGALWNSVGGVYTGWQPGNVTCLHAGVDASGPALFVGGDFSVAGGLVVENLARFDGIAWSALGGGIEQGSVEAITTWESPSGPQVIVGGNFHQAGGTSVSRIAAWDGAAWSDLGGGMSATFAQARVSALGVFDAGKGASLYAGGTFDLAGGVACAGVAAWDGLTWSPLSTGVVGGGVLALEALDAGSGASLYLGGDFTLAGTVLADRIASFDGARFHTVGAANALAYDDDIHAMTSFDDGSGPALWLGGMATGAGDVAQARGVVRFDGQTWTGLPGGIRVDAFATFDDGGGTRLYVGGLGSGGECVAGWDGASWVPLPGGPTPVTTCTSLCAYDDGTGPALYMGSLLGQRLYRWKDGVWSAVLPGPSGGVDRLIVFDDGHGPALFVGGRFSQVAGVTSPGVARFDGTTWSSLGTSLVSQSGGPVVLAFAAHDDGSGPMLYIGGRFGGGLVRWNGSVTSGLGVGLSPDVYALASHDDGTGHGPQLFVAGIFSTVATQPASNIARWDGASWSAVDAGITGTPGTQVLTLGSFDDGTTRALYAGGRFQRAGGHVSEGFARLDGCGLTGALYCFGDGSSGACPCGNESAQADRAGCLHSLGTGGALRAHGRSSLSGDTLSLDGSAMTNSAVLYVQGAGASAGGPFGDGIKCTAGPFVRLGTRTNVAGASSFPGGIGPSLSVKGLVVQPGTRTYQARYRNSAPFCTSDTFNYTNGVILTWSP